MRDDYDRLVEYALWAWRGQRQYGMSGVRNVQGGVWVVLKLAWQPLHPRAPLLNPVGFSQALHQPHPLLFLLLGLCGSTGAFCFSFNPITTFFFLFASAAASVLDPEWMLRLLWTFYKFGMYCSTLLSKIIAM